MCHDIILAASLSCPVGSTNEVTAHKIIVPREELEIQQIPPLVRNFILFANRNSSKNNELLTKN